MQLYIKKSQEHQSERPDGDYFCSQLQRGRDDDGAICSGMLCESGTGGP